MLNLMYITNSPQIATIADSVGVDRIFIDLETIGKANRQKGRDTVISNHCLSDIPKVKEKLKQSKLLVRINPIHNAVSGYLSSEDEIDVAVENGADILMLPYFTSAKEVESFVAMSRQRVSLMPLVETPEAVEQIDEILSVGGFDEIYVGLNDLSIGYGKRFMFELLADGTVERLCEKFQSKGLKYGFGGIASIGKGLLKSEYIIKEHYRLRSNSVILSRSFCDLNQNISLTDIQNVFLGGIKAIRDLERECLRQSFDYFAKNQTTVKKIVREICERNGCL